MVYDYTNGKRLNYKVIVFGVGLDDVYIFNDYYEALRCFEELKDAAECDTKITLIDVSRGEDIADEI